MTGRRGRRASLPLRLAQMQAILQTRLSATHANVCAYALETVNLNPHGFQGVDKPPDRLLMGARVGRARKGIEFAHLDVEPTSQSQFCEGPRVLGCVVHIAQ